MSNYDWEKIESMLEKLIEDEAMKFNEESLYHLLRRYKPQLPFNFNKYITECKECLGVDFIQRRVVIYEILRDEFDEDLKVEFLSYLLYHFHKMKLHLKNLHELENYLDKNK